MKNKLFFSVVISFLLFSCVKKNREYTILPQVQFAIQQIKKAAKLNPKKINSNAVSFKIDTINLKSEAYKISVQNNEVIIEGGDAKGLMYGGLELAEQITLDDVPKATTGSPFIKKRGIKFNIPLDARTPSYDDSGDAAQKNIKNMWDFSFWTAFLDDMAINRYNSLTLWNPHPFPSMIKQEKYPAIALDDIKVTTLKPVGKENEWGDPQLVTDNVMANLKVVKSITIDEKIIFWKKVMRYAKERGIDTYFITWNICPNSVATPVKPYHKTFNNTFREEKPGKYGITHQMNNPKTIEYYKDAVKTFLLTYPDVKGIGVTAGEYMALTHDDYDKEKWLWETYGKGILEAKKQQPKRIVNFIHRVWYSDMKQIMKYWKQYPDPFEVSFKYAKARLYSSPYLDFSKEHSKEMKSYGIKSWWNLRNDDIFVYRWGDADYVRKFLNYFPKDDTAGYHMGSDGYVWGKEFISKTSELSGQLELKKHWYNFMLWGRLGYNNELSDSFFNKKLKHHFPQVDEKKLSKTWKTASKIIPLINTFHWRVLQDLL